MFDEIRLSQRFNCENMIIYSTFQIKVDNHESKFIKYEYLDDGGSDKNSIFKKAMEFKQKTLPKVNKIFKLTDNDISLIEDEIEKLRCSNFKDHDYRINQHMDYNIDFLENGKMLDNININLKYKKELIEFNNSLINIFKFPIFDVSFLDMVVTEYDYDIKREGIYLKNTFNKLNLKNLHFEITSGLFNIIIFWSLDFNKKTFNYLNKTYKLNNRTIRLINNLIGTYGVYNWFYPQYYEKMEYLPEYALDGYSWKLTFNFEDDKKLVFGTENGYPDTYPQLAFKIKEIFGIDMLKTDCIDDLELYHYYGDKKIKKINEIEIIEEYILIELILKFHPLIDFYVVKFPKSLNKKYEFIFEYDVLYENKLHYIKEVIISKLQECYDNLGLKYNFFVILYPVDYLSDEFVMSLIDFYKMGLRYHLKKLQ